jgi:hypothetical protein
LGITLKPFNGAEQQPQECKIFAPSFNIVSALAVKYLGVGRILARIFQVYNNVIYSNLRETKRKTRLF